MPPLTVASLATIRTSRPETRTTPVTKADDARLEEVRRIRKENFAQHGAADERRQMVPGRSWAAWGRALAMLLPPLDVADLGCGDGYLTIEAARFARKVISIDRSAEVLARGKALAARKKITNIRWKRGDLERLPIPDASVDVALLSQALHHAGDPAGALSEARRILRPGGRVLVLDLREHGEACVRNVRFIFLVPDCEGRCRQGLVFDTDHWLILNPLHPPGDRWLGFSDDQLRTLLAGAGFDHVQVRVGARRTGDPFTVLIATGTKKDTPDHVKD